MIPGLTNLGMLFRKKILILHAISSVRARLRVQSRNNLSKKAAGLRDQILAKYREKLDRVRMCCMC